MLTQRHHLVDPPPPHLAKVAPDRRRIPTLLIVLEAAGHRGPIFSQLHALQLLGHALRDALGECKAATGRGGGK